tara:strand:- start:155 stop:625 length:471 start_codon:yes stop_codon:yes gene_type:complete
MKIKEALLRVGDLIKQVMVGKLNASTKGTGDLANSIKYQVEDPGDGKMNLVRSMNAYGNNVDAGVKGWDNKKGIPNPNSLYDIGQFRHRTIAQESGLPYPVRYVIARDGLTPKPFIVPSITSVIQNQGKELLLNASIDEIDILIDTNSQQNIKIRA